MEIYNPADISKNKDNNTGFRTLLPFIISALVLIIVGILIFVIFNIIDEQQAPVSLEKSNPLENNNIIIEPTPNYGPVAGQLLVKFKRGVPESVIKEHLKQLNIKQTGKIEGVNVTILEVPVGQEENIRNILSKDSIVQYAERNYYAHTTANPNDTDFGKEWGFLNTGGAVVDPKTNKSYTGTANADAHIVDAWSVTKGTGINVGVVDTGIDTTHPELADKIIETTVFATSTIDDGFGHGTHIAGVIAADTNNTQGIAGSCPDCRLYIAKSLDDNGNGDLAGIAQGITWAADKGAKVINISAGGSSNPQALTDAVKYAQGKGVLVVAASGNANTSKQFYPAAISGVMSVASTDNSDKMSSFSNHGSWVQIAAPGFAIYSTLPHSRDPNLRKLYPNITRIYGSLSGTSMASPFVSGVAALVFSTQYGTSADAVKKRLCDTADKIPGTGTNWVCGRLNAAAAVGYVANANPTAQPSVAPTPIQAITSMPPTGTIIPTFVCGGSGVGNNCPPTPTPTGNGGGSSGPTSIPAGSTNPNSSAGQPTVNPNDINGTSNPNNSSANQSPVNNPKNIKTAKGLIRFFLDLIKMILNLIKSLLKFK